MNTGISDSQSFTGPTIVLHRPQIPQNTGNISRLCVGLNSKLIITGKAGFSFDQSSVRRAGLDHWSELDFEHHIRFKNFYLKYKGRRIIAITKSGTESVLNYTFIPGDVLLFGNETMGLPPTLLRLLAQSAYIPMYGKIRSLNLSNSVAIAAYQYVASAGNRENMYNPDQYPRTYYKETKQNG
jgi:tRNA (cytidine/uridine-2'-O-)-methyltransferase